jgi:hypothetical protein
MTSPQMAWLEEDLSAVDRSVTPWVMVMSHFPMYHTSLDTNADTSAEWYTSARAEFAETGHEFLACDAVEDAQQQQCTTVRDHVGQMQAVLDPIFAKHGVDFYNAGHVHDYTVNWPMNNGNMTGQKDYTDPKGTIHICEGNGGVPSAALHSGAVPCKADYCRIHMMDPAYGRWVVHNASVVEYQHVPNDPAHTMNSETWFVHTKSHGPFALAL